MIDERFACPSCFGYGAVAAGPDDGEECGLCDGTGRCPDSVPPLNDDPPDEEPW